MVSRYDSKKIALVEVTKRNFEINRACNRAVVYQSIRSGFTHLPECNKMSNYMAVLLNATPTDFADVSVGEEVGSLEKKLCGTQVVQQGLQQMLAISIAAIELSVCCNINIFSGVADSGIALAILLVKCE